MYYDGEIITRLQSERTRQLRRRTATRGTALLERLRHPRDRETPKDHAAPRARLRVRAS